MKPRTLSILAVLAAAALGAAWWRSSGGSSSGAEPGSAFLDGFSARINEVARVELDDGEKPVAFEKRDGGWVDPARGGYPVKKDEVHRLLIGLRGLEKREAKTSRPERHAELKLALESGEGRGKLLRVFLAGQEAPAWELVVGESKWSPVRGQYMRLKGEDQCWFAAGELSLPYEPTAWLDKEIANVNQQDVARIVLVRGPESFTITRPDDAAPWSLAELPEGRKLKEFAPFGSLANALGYLNFEDVAPAADERFARGPDLVAEFACFNQASIRLEGWKIGEGETPEIWVRPASTPPPAAAPSEGEAAGGEDAASGETLRGPSAETLAGWEAKWNGWAYRLPDWKAKALQQGLDDWLEPPPAEAPAEAPAAPAAEDEGDGE
jgi:hypothetical protein